MLKLGNYSGIMPKEQWLGFVFGQVVLQQCATANEHGDMHFPRPPGYSLDVSVLVLKGDSCATVGIKISIKIWLFIELTDFGAIH